MGWLNVVNPIPIIFNRMSLTHRIDGVLTIDFGNGRQLVIKS